MKERSAQKRRSAQRRSEGARRRSAQRRSEGALSAGAKERLVKECHTGAFSDAASFEGVQCMRAERRSAQRRSAQRRQEGVQFYAGSRGWSQDQG